MVEAMGSALKKDAGQIEALKKEVGQPDNVTDADRARSIVETDEMKKLEEEQDKEVTPKYIRSLVILYMYLQLALYICM